MSIVNTLIANFPAILAFGCFCHTLRICYKQKKDLENKSETINSAWERNILLWQKMSSKDEENNKIKKMIEERDLEIKFLNRNLQLERKEKEQYKKKNTLLKNKVKEFKMPIILEQSKNIILKENSKYCETCEICKEYDTYFDIDCLSYGAMSTCDMILVDAIIEHTIILVEQEYFSKNCRPLLYADVTKDYFTNECNGIIMSYLGYNDESILTIKHYINFYVRIMDMKHSIDKHSKFFDIINFLLEINDDNYSNYVFINRYINTIDDFLKDIIKIPCKDRSTYILEYIYQEYDSDY